MTPTELRTRRQSLGLTQERLAQMLGVAANTVARWERGERPIRSPALVRLALERIESAAPAEFGDASGPRRRQRLRGKPAPTVASHAAVAATRANSHRNVAAAQPALAPRSSNLPAGLSSFVGREREVARITALLRRNRLVTLVGPGGIGKTRLALAIGAEEAPLCPGGVWLVDLAPVGDEQLVPHTVAQVLGIREGPHKRPPLEMLTESLRERQLVLVLDNCEHLVEIVARLAQALLRRCPGLRVLATSREPFEIEGEIVCRVPPLPYPEAWQVLPLADVEHYPSVALFVERAMAACSDFQLTPQNAGSIAELCARLEGMPLALELAAARLNSLSVEQVVERLDDRFRLLSTGRRTSLRRHQTLHATLDWSHVLLTPQEQVLFRRLAVFVGGWTLIAAEAVCSDAILPERNVFNALDGLVSKSLVNSHDGSRIRRYVMLETVRQYAFERLEAAGEVSEFRQHHRRWMVDLVESKSPELYEASMLVVLDQEQDNLRAALRSSLDDGDANAALRLSSNWLFWYMRGHYTEGRTWLAAALDHRAAQARVVLRGRAICAMGYLAYLQGDLKAAEVLLEDGRAIALELGDGALEAVALHQLGNVAKARGDLARAARLVADALSFNRRLGNQAWLTLNLLTLSEVKLEAGEFDEARDLAQACHELARELGHTWSLARSLHYLGRLAQKTGDIRAARALLQESLAVQRGFGGLQGLASTLMSLGSLALQQEDAAEAGQYFGEALRVSRDISEPTKVATCLSRTAMLVSETDPAQAVRLASAADGLWEAFGAQPYASDRAEFDRNLHSLEKRIGSVAFAAAAVAGRKCPLDEAILTAIAVADDCASRAFTPPENLQVTSNDPLTRREREVAGLIARGLSNREIARVLVIGEGTASNHVQHILEKLCFHARAQIASWATVRGLAAGELIPLS